MLFIFIYHCVLFLYYFIEELLSFSECAVRYNLVRDDENDANNELFDVVLNKI
jgi:hypothetical protein